MGLQHLVSQTQYPYRKITNPRSPQDIVLPLRIKRHDRARWRVALGSRRSAHPTAMHSLRLWTHLACAHAGARPRLLCVRRPRIPAPPRTAARPLRSWDGNGSCCAGSPLAQRQVSLTWRDAPRWRPETLRQTTVLRARSHASSAARSGDDVFVVPL